MFDIRLGSISLKSQYHFIRPNFTESQFHLRPFHSIWTSDPCRNVRLLTRVSDFSTWNGSSQPYYWAGLVSTRGKHSSRFSAMLKCSSVKKVHELTRVGPVSSTVDFSQSCLRHRKVTKQNKVTRQSIISYLPSVTVSCSYLLSRKCWSNSFCLSSSMYFSRFSRKLFPTIVRLAKRSSLPVAKCVCGMVLWLATLFR